MHPQPDKVPLGVGNDMALAAVCRVEEGRGCVPERKRSVSPPRSSNRTCGATASGFPTGLVVRPTGRRSLPATKTQHAQFLGDVLSGDLARATSLQLVPFAQEVADAVMDMSVNGFVGRCSGAVAEVRRPTEQNPV